MGEVYKRVKEFKEKHPMTIAWRLKQNSKVVERHINPDEYVIYAFAAQKSANSLDVFSTAVIALTNKRILMGRKRALFGYFLNSITPDMFNDLTIKHGIIWGKVIIDTVKEQVMLSNVDPNALAEIDDNITMYMLEQKKELNKKETKKESKKTK